MGTPLSVLIIEDSEDDALLVVRGLRRGNFEITWERVETAEALRSALMDRSWDVILSDYTLPCLDAPAALKIVKSSQLDVPFIVIAGSIGERLAVDMMKAGAHDYVMKQNLTRLPEAIRRELREAQMRAERKRAEVALIQSEAKNRAILAAIPDYLFRIGADGIYREVVTYQDGIALFPGDFNPVGLTMTEILPSEIATQQLHYLARAISTGELQTYEQVVSVGEAVRYEEVRVIQSGQDEALFMVRDISDRKRTEIALQNLIAGTAATTGQDFFPALVSHIAQALDVSYAMVSERIDKKSRSLAFWTSGALHPVSLAYGLDHTPCQQVLQQGEFYCERSLKDLFPEAAVLADMSVESYLGIALKDAQGNAIGILCILHHRAIPDPRRATQILRVFAARASAELERQRTEAAMKRQLAAIEAAIDGIGILQGDTYLYVNQAHLDLFGYEQSDDLVGKSWRVLYPSSEIQRFEQDVFPVLARDRAWRGEAIAQHRDGSTFPQGLSLTLTEDELLICVCRDIQALKQAQAQIIHNALHDPLTSLPNRSLLAERLELAILRAQQLEHGNYAVLFLDLDRFKVVNDSLGHLVGDQLLIAVAQRLKCHLRDTDVVARLGGDEFVILLEGINGAEEVLQIAERILADCQLPLIIEGHSIVTNISMGIVLGTPDYQQATDLIRDADIAMYQAKTEKHNSYRFFNRDMHTQALGRLTLETDLRRALEQEELVLHYQPIVDMHDCQLAGFEALVRWQHPTRGLILPNEFIPIAEETGLIVELDNWVIRQACQQMVSWRSQLTTCLPLKISVNLSPQDLRDTTWIHHIDQILVETGLASNTLMLEITEGMLIEDIEPTIDLLAQLASKQIRISIDDFGTGYSSLEYLHRLPIHTLKIDASFVCNMQSDHRNYQVVSTIIALGKQLGLTVVAEGIERQQQLQQLRQLGCQWGQGYLFSKPLTVLDVSAYCLQNEWARACGRAPDRPASHRTG